MPSHAHTLYVVLQGEFTLSRERKNAGDDILHIAAPQLEGHSYKAGPWLSDWKHLAELPDTLLYLRNAIGDRKQGANRNRLRHHPRSIPEKNADLLMTCGPETAVPSGARVHIIAPIPLALLSGLAESTRGVAITFTPPNGQPTVRAAPPHPASIMVLLYKFYGNLPYLSGEDDKHIADIGGASDDLKSLNIYASSEDDDESPAHAQAAFAAAAKLLGEQASLSFPGGAFFQRLPATPPAGLTWAQVNFFFSDVIRFYGNPILEEDFVDLQDKRLPFDPVHMTGGSFTNCGPQTGDDDGLD